MLAIDPTAGKLPAKLAKLTGFVKGVLPIAVVTDDARFFTVLDAVANAADA
jgi:hypothetical protein